MGGSNCVGIEKAYVDEVGCSEVAYISSLSSQYPLSLWMSCQLQLIECGQLFVFLKASRDKNAEDSPAILVTILTCLPLYCL